MRLVNPTIVLTIAPVIFTIYFIQQYVEKKKTYLLLGVFICLFAIIVRIPYLGPYLLGIMESHRLISKFMAIFIAIIFLYLFFKEIFLYFRGHL